MTSIMPRSFFDYSPLHKMSIFEGIDDFFSIPAMTGINDFSISEDDKHIHVDAALPGIKPEDIEVTFDKGVLWIRGQAKEENKNRKFYKKAQQAFSYSIAVPGDVDLKAEPKVTYGEGMIRITLAKSRESQPKKLTITVNDKKEKSK